MKSENKKKTDEYEKCVICGAETNVPKTMNIEHRLNYVMGVGQLCNECAKAQKIMR